MQRDSCSGACEPHLEFASVDLNVSNVMVPTVAGYYASGTGAHGVVKNSGEFLCVTKLSNHHILAQTSLGMPQHDFNAGIQCSCLTKPYTLSFRAKLPVKLGITMAIAMAKAISTSTGCLCP
ncbi:hypothetical protein M758_2G206600 [Ceratodon purpureus]|nr:hypothetical protein M758_2G206600 [Ceratodon purpureus]